MHQPFRPRCALPAALALLALLAAWPAARAQDNFIGQIMCGAFNFAPRGWARLDGQILPIASNTALFSLLGTQYGGNGISNFALPDLRGRGMVQSGQGPGLSDYVQGETGGAESVTLSTATMPAHSHVAPPPASLADATLVSPAGAVPATKGRALPLYAAAGAVGMAPLVTATAGSGAPQPVTTMPRHVVINCFIATTGIFPPRP